MYELLNQSVEVRLSTVIDVEHGPEAVFLDHGGIGNGRLQRMPSFGRLIAGYRATPAK